MAFFKKGAGELPLFDYGVSGRAHYPWAMPA